MDSGQQFKEAQDEALTIKSASNEGALENVASASESASKGASTMSEETNPEVSGTEQNQEPETLSCSEGMESEQIAPGISGEQTVGSESARRRLSERLPEPSESAQHDATKPTVHTSIAHEKRSSSNWTFVGLVALALTLGGVAVADLNSEMGNKWNFQNFLTPSHTAMDQVQWFSHSESAKQAHDQGDHEQEAVELKEALPLAESMGAKSDELQDTLGRLGDVYQFELDKSAIAEPYYRQQIAVLQEKEGDKPSRTQALALDDLGIVLHALKRYDEAATYYKQAIDITEKLGGDKGDLGQYWYNLALAYGEGDKTELEAQAHKKALKIRQEGLDPDDTDIAESLSAVGDTYYDADNFKEARPYYDKALAIFQKADDDSNIADTLQRIGNNISQQDDYQKGLPFLQQAMEKRQDAVAEPEDDGSTPAVAQKDVDFSGYMSDLQKQIKAEWYPPSSKTSMHPRAFFSVDRAGRVSGVKIDRTSGDKRADFAAMQAVFNSAPFPELPAGSPKSVDIQFSFDYNVTK